VSTNARQRAAAYRFSVGSAGKNTTANLSGGAPYGRLAVFKEGAFAYFSVLSAAGSVALYDMEDGEWHVSECVSTGAAWNISVTDAVAVVTPVISAAYPIIPIGSRLLAIKNGKLVAVTPA
jgi:hypothetical protein